MKKIKFLKLIALSAAALMTFSLSGCEYISKIIGGINSGENNITGGNNQSDPELTISQTEISLAVGSTVQLHAFASDGSTVTWSSLDTAVATVDDGLVKGIAEGETLVWAETDSLMKTCTVKVTAAQTEPPQEETLELSQSTLSLEVGSSATLTATCSIAGATVKWNAIPSSYVSVSNGKVTALKKGNALVVATVDLPDGGKLQATCTVTVTAPEGSDKNGYKLVWCDEFNGNSLDTTKWGYQHGTQDQYGTATGAAFWGNDELQYYTEDAVTVSGGSLKITATKRNMDNGRTYSSGRILTRDKASWTYGYFEARMKTPTGNGMWPAFWMLPQPSGPNTLDNQYGGWPANGEIDIMEAKGRLYNVVDTTLHFGKAWNAHDYASGTTTLESNTDRWHTYAVDWTSDAIIWYIDGQYAFKVDKNRWWSQDVSNQGQTMPFDKPFYILLNLAVGGQYDNYEAPADSFSSATMEVDYVRVYEKA